MPTAAQLKEAFDYASSDPNNYFNMNDEGKKAFWQYGKDNGLISRGNLSTQAQTEWDKYSETPLDNSRYNIVGSNMIQRYKEDTPLKAAGKDIVNYGLGTVGRIFSAPQQAIMQADRAAVNAATGKPQDFSQMSFGRDILGAKEDNLLTMAASTVLDPTTYIGGGIIDDLTRAGMMGAGAKAGTAENLTASAARGQRATKGMQPAAQTATKEYLNAERMAAKKDAVQTPDVIYATDKGNVVSGQNVLALPEGKPSSVGAQVVKSERERLGIPQYAESAGKTDAPFNATKAEQEQATALARAIGMESNTVPFEKLVSENGVHVSTKAGEKVRQFGETALEASVGSPEYKAALKADMPTYTPISNKDTLQKAENIVNANEGVAKNIFSSAGKGGTTADDVALGEVLIKKAIESGDVKEANRLTVDLATKLTEAGQAVQAASIFKRMTPEGMLMYAQRTVGNVNRDLEKSLGKVAKKVELTPEESQFITDTMQKIQGMQDGRPKDIELAKVMQMIANKEPSGISDEILAAQRISLLLNPKSMIRNAVGNTIFGIIDNISNVVATPIDKLVGLKTGQRTTTLPDVAGQIKSGIQGAKEVIEDARLGIDTSPFRSQFELPSKQIFQGNGPLSKAMNVMDQTTRTGLKLGDTPFYKAAYDDVLRQQMKLANVAEPTTAMIEQAQKVAQQRTYQDVNSLTNAFKMAQRALNFGKPAGLGNVVLPFVKTPANILKRAIEYSPLGVEKAIREGYNLAKHTGKFSQKAFVDSIAKSVTGTAMIMVGYDLAKKGYITGQANKDRDIAAFEKNMGKSEYAFKFGDNYYTYDWMQPGSMALAIGADMYLSGKERKDAENVVVDAVKSGGQTLFKQSLLQGVQRFMGGYSPMDNLEETLANALSQLTPTLGKQIAQMTDSTQRTTADNSTVKSAVNNIKARIPGLSQTLEPKVDTFGNDMENYQGKNNIFNVMFNPGFSTEYKPTREQQEIIRLYVADGSKDIFPKVAPKTLQYQSESIQLTPSEITQFQRTMGKLTEEKFGNIMEQSGYDKMADKVKVIRLKGAIDSAYEVAKRELLKARGLVK
jgi:hypothetical protein